MCLSQGQYDILHIYASLALLDLLSKVPVVSSPTLELPDNIGGRKHIDEFDKLIINYQIFSFKIYIIFNIHS